MSTNDLQFIKDLYGAFARGDMEAVLGAMAPAIEWREAENNKLADRNPYVGPQAVLEGVFMRLGDDFDDFQVHPERFAASDGEVAMEGRYSARCKATGDEINPQVVHWCTLKDGKVVRFQQHIDTLALGRGLGEV